MHFICTLLGKFSLQLFLLLFETRAGSPPAPDAQVRKQSRQIPLGESKRCPAVLPWPPGSAQPRPPHAGYKIRPRRGRDTTLTMGPGQAVGLLLLLLQVSAGCDSPPGHRLRTRARPAGVAAVSYPQLEPKFRF